MAVGSFLYINSLNSELSNFSSKAYRNVQCTQTTRVKMMNNSRFLTYEAWSCSSEVFEFLRPN